jgi:hypothetical protein
MDLFFLSNGVWGFSLFLEVNFVHDLQLVHRAYSHFQLTENMF